MGSTFLWAFVVEINHKLDILDEISEELFWEIYDSDEPIEVEFQGKSLGKYTLLEDKQTFYPVNY